MVAFVVTTRHLVSWWWCPAASNIIFTYLLVPVPCSGSVFFPRGFWPGRLIGFQYSIPYNTILY